MPDAVVIKVEKKAEKNALIHFDVGQVAWSPDFEVASKLLIGKPLPADWTVKTGEFGPQAFPPRPKGSAPQAAWRNTKEGFLAEAEGRQRWQHVEEERRDRRTALMQAVSFPADFGESAIHNHTVTHTLEIADEFYTWLRQTSGGSSPGESASAFSSSQQETAPPEPTSAYGEGAAAADPGGQDSSPQGTVDPDAIASKETWDDVLSKGVKASVALKIARKIWPDAGIRGSTELTNAQLGSVLMAYLEGERG